jgi:hypothetical protein
MPFLPPPSPAVPVVILATIVLIAWVAWGSFTAPEKLWAPGDLSRYHRDAARCVQCHEPFRGVRSNRCLECHAPVRLTALPRPDDAAIHRDVLRKGQPCVDCHTEHHGATAPITIGTSGNPHAGVIFRMTKTESCTQCHAFAREGGQPLLLETPPVKRLLQQGKGSHTPGRFARCLRCHTDEE